MNKGEVVIKELYKSDSYCFIQIFYAVHEQKIQEGLMDSMTIFLLVYNFVFTLKVVYSWINYYWKCIVYGLKQFLKKIITWSGAAEGRGA